MRTKCTTCGKEFAKKSTALVQAALAMHIARVHGKCVVPGQKRGNDNVIQNASPPQPGVDFQPEQSVPISVPEKSAKQIKKLEYQRKWRAAHPKASRNKKASQQNGVVKIRFCPVCGHNMELFTAALNVAHQTAIQGA